MLNVYQAQKLGYDILTVPPVIMSKLKSVGKSVGKSVEQVSLDTIKGFARDISSLVKA